MKHRLHRIISKTWKVINKAGKFTGDKLSVVFRPFKKIIGKIITKFPHKYRIKIYNFQKKFENPRIKYTSIGLAILLVVIPLIVYQFKFNDHEGLPWNEKIADGAWILHNREPIHQVLASPKKGPNLRQVDNSKLKVKSGETVYKWSAKLPSGTVFEFGGVTSDTSEGQVSPEVNIKSKDGWFVRYTPKHQIPNTKYQFVTPKVKGNIIEWEIAEGITARYEMLSDRVKADYIVKNKSSIAKNRLDFDVYSGREGSESGKLTGELMPEGDINWFTGSENSLQNIFIFPTPVTKDSKNNEITSQYVFSGSNAGVYSLSIVLEASEIGNASFPLIVDPVVIDASSATTGTAYGNSRKILRDGWGNLIALFDGGAGDDNVYFKNYNSSTWTDAGIDLDEGAGSAQNISADIDSAGNVYAAFRNSTDSDIEYAKLYVIRSGNNTISRVVPLSVEEIDTSDAANRPSLVVVNKGGGEGVEKVVISYGVSAASREEARVVTRDIRTEDYAETILNTSGLVGYFRLGESSSDTAYDLSATKNNGSYTGSPTRGETGAINGESDTSARFNGSSQYVTATDNDAYDFGTGDFSVEVWVLRPTSPSGAEFLVAHSGDNGADDWELFWASGNDKISSRIYTVSVDSGLEDISDGKWHHVVVTMDRDGYGRIYKDGVLSGTPTDISSMASLNLTNTSLLYLARRATTGYFAGRMDDVSIYNKALSASEVSDHYNKGNRTKYYDEVINTSGLVGYWKLDELSGTNANDESSTNNDGTYTGGYTLGMQGVQPGASSSAVRFDGSTGYVTIPDNDAYSLSTTNELTVAFWSKPNSTSGDGAVVAKGTASNYEWAIFRENNASSYYAIIYQTGGASSATLPGPGSIPHGRSTFVVLTMNETTDTAKFYINGESIGTVTSWTGSRANGTSPVNIGRLPTPGSYYNGIADEVSIYNRVLTDSEIQTLYDYGSTWKNASEEKYSTGDCNDSSVEGGSGMPNSATCRGAADQVLNEASNTSHHSVINQFPASAKRSPDSVKWDDNSVFSNLSNTFDGSTSTENNVNALTTVDYIYIGDDKPFSKASFDINYTNGSGGGNFTSTNVEYCSLSYDDSTCTTWSDLPQFVDNTYDGTESFDQDGSIFFSQPDNWAKNTVDSVTGKYWIRIRPDAAMDSSVSINEIYLTDRNSRALMLTGGIDNSNDLRTSYIVWDEVTNSRWEENLASRGDGFRDDSGGASSAIDVNGANWTTFTNFPLSSTVDYKNNRIYVGYVEDIATDVMHVKSISSTKDPTVAANWTDTGFPTVTEGTDLAMSLSSDQSDIYAFYLLDPGTNNLVFRRCTGIAATHNGVCDSANDWGSERIIYQDSTIDHPSVIATKFSSDIVGVDALFTDETDSDVLHERLYVDMADSSTPVAASTDDSFHRDCDTGTDDSDVTWTGIVVGRDEADGQCVASANASDHGGFRFPAINVARGVKISSAYIDVKVQRVWGSGNALDFTIYGEDTDDSSAFPGSANCVDPCSGAVGTRTRTTSANAQSIDFEGDLSAYGPGLTYRFDITDLVQEIVCRGAPADGTCAGDFGNTSGNWAPGNDLSILMISNEAEDNQVEFFSYDHTTTANVDPTIQINCETSCAATSSATVSTTWCQIGTVDGNSSNDCNENWKARKKITFDNRASSENLTNFPVLIRLDSSSIDYTKTGDSGQDLRFVDSDGTTLLSYEIEKWNESGESIVWVNVPQINSGVASDFVWLYYDNDSTDYWTEVLADNPAVLLKMDEASGNLTDTQVGNNAVVSGTGLTYRAQGPTDSVPYGVTFDAGSIATITDSADVDLGNGPFTIEVWLKRPNTGAQYNILQKNADGVGTDGYQIWHSNLNAYRLAQGDGSNDIIGEVDTDTGWHHYVFTRGSGTDGHVYRDGVEMTSNQAQKTFSDNNDNLIIGLIADGNKFVGSMAGLAIYKTELSPTRILAHYNSSGQNPTGTWNSNYKAVWHLREDPSDFCLQDDYAACDSTSNNNDTFMEGAMTSSQLVNGQIGNSNNFDGNDDLARDNPLDISSLPGGNSARTFEGWFRTTNNDASSRAILGYGTQIDPQDIAMVIGDGALYIQIRSTSNAFQSADTVNDGKWHYAAVSYDGTNFEGYVDGVEVGTDYNPSTNPNTNVATGNFDIGVWSAFFIGSLDEVRISDNDRSADWIEANYLNMKSDSTFVNIGAEQEFVSQEESVTPYSKEILGTSGLVGYFRLGESATDPVARDYSSTGNNGRYINTPTLGVSGAILGDTNTAATFDSASTQYVNVPDNNVYDFGTGDYSLEAWVKIPSTPANSQFILGHNGNSSGSDWEFLKQPNNQIFGSRVGDSSTPCDSGNSTTVTDNKWHHIVVTMDRDGLCKWYIDGSLSGTPTDISGASGTNITSTDPLYIGRRQSTTCNLGNCYFNGSMDDVAIYKGVVLSSAQIQKHYQLGSGAPVASTGTKKYSKGFTSPLSRSVLDLGYTFSTADYAVVEGDDNTYSVASGNLDATASPSASPMFLFKINNPSNSNSSQFSVNAVVKSSVPPSARPIYLQVYNGNIDNWTTLATLNSGGQDTEATLTGSSGNFGGDLNAFYHNESPGTGTRYTECTNGSSNCWLYFRVYQDAPGAYVSENLSLDMFNLEFGETETAQSGLRGKTRLRGGTRLR